MTSPSRWLMRASAWSTRNNHEVSAVAARTTVPHMAATRARPGTAPQLRKALKRASPSLRNERELWDEGREFVIGVDEVGRGSWAGPLTIGAVILPRDKRVNKVRDSKMLTEREREALFDRIKDWSVAWGVGGASHEECDELGMSEAQRL